MKTISVAIATFNEEDNIGNCLSSVADLIDEIVIVDGSSTDKTIEIAKKYRAKVILTDNPSIFHINKQKAIDACKGDWVLQLDADEIVSQELKNEILKVIRSDSSINGYWLPRKNYILGKWLKKGGQYPDYTLRLYKKGKGKLPCKSVHEQAQVEGETGFLSQALLHHPYPDFFHYLEHFNRYTTILAEELLANNVRIDLKSFFSFMVFKPFYWFIFTFLRHKGFQDGFPGFVFSFFSSLRFPVSYIKYWEKRKRTTQPLD